MRRSCAGAAALAFQARSYIQAYGPMEQHLKAGKLRVLAVPCASRTLRRFPPSRERWARFIAETGRQPE